MLHFLAEFSRVETVEAAARALLIFPVGAVEQHGPHLPVGTDSLIVSEVAQAAAQLAAEQDGPLPRPPLDDGRFGARRQRHRPDLHRPDPEAAQRGQRPLVAGQLRPEHHRRREMQAEQGARQARGWPGVAHQRDQRRTRPMRAQALERAEGEPAGLWRGRRKSSGRKSVW
jgi:hypothetical protein